MGQWVRERPHFELSVEEFLRQKRREPMSKWLPPVESVKPKRTRLKQGPRLGVYEKFWEKQAEDAERAKLRGRKR
jgi:hypothetical protein